MLPVDFIDSMTDVFPTELDAFCRALREPPVVSIRLNDKCAGSDLEVMRESDGRVPWTTDGYYLTHRPAFTLDPLLHAGCYYVQDASSMFLEHVLRHNLQPQSVVLDLCAAPGGKATLISRFLGEQGLLVANEVVRQRVFVLSENIQKWGNGNTVVTHNQPAVFSSLLPYAFDCMVVDAPCSGEGMFRKDEKAVDEWSLDNVKMCQQRQKQILTDAWGCLKPGGLLVYSTCTFNPLENEQVAHFIADELGADYVSVPIEPQWGIQETYGYHFYPHKVRGEGLYMAVFRKRTVPFLSPKLKLDKRRISGKVEQESLLRSWLKNPDKWAIRQTERFTNAYPAKFKELIDYISSCFTCISVGFGLSELRGRMPAPQHSLSMAKDFRQEMFKTVELDLPTAISYLRCEAIVLDQCPIGFLLLTYKNIPLGFTKNIGNHCNNLYPKEWRIRKAE